MNKPAPVGSKGMRLGVVILNWENADDTMACLAQLQHVREQFPQTRIVVVDNGSQDNSIEILHKNQYQHIYYLMPLAENRGFAAGVNAGVQWLLDQMSEYVLILNSDTLLTADFLMPLWRCLVTHETAGIATPKIRYTDAPDHIWYAGGMFQQPRFLGTMVGIGKKDQGQFDEPRVVDFATGCCILVKRAVFETIGLFDEDFFLYHEDVDFCLRAQQAGFQTWYCPESLIWHRVSFSTKDRTSMRIRLYSRNRFVFFAKHIHGWRWAWVLALEGIRLVRKVMIHFLHGRLCDALAYTRGVYEGFWWAARYKLTNQCTKTPDTSSH